MGSLLVGRTRGQSTDLVCPNGGTIANRSLGLAHGRPRGQHLSVGSTDGRPPGVSPPSAGGLRWCSGRRSTLAVATRRVDEWQEEL